MRAVFALCLILGLTSHELVAQEVTRGTGAVLRGLEKVTGQVQDMELASGASQTMGRISVKMHECRYPAGNPAGDAFAFLTIMESGNDTPVFQGWMVASSPALNALEHPRYDVWVLRCKTE